MRENSSAYRPEIDGLRALAVIPVVLFHAGYPVASGGYVGVDVFFVISGFLITSIILRDLEGGQFSLQRFYERRARRILPALFLVMLACIPVSIWLMVPFQLEDFSQSLVATLFFGSNFFFWWKSGYFEADAEQMPLLHTWSLSIEEQFYIVFPLLLLALARISKRNLLLVMATFAAISLLSAEYGWRTAPEANFFFPTSRAWELLAGAMCAVVIRKRALTPSFLLGFLGVVCIILSVILYSAETPYPSALTVLPVLGTVLIILYTDQRGGVGRILAMPFFRGIGLISYSLYLWHMPALAFLRIYYFGDPPAFAIAAAVGVSFGLAYLSWKFVEMPYRIRSSIGLRTLAVRAGAAAAVLLSVGLAGHLSSGFYSMKKTLLDVENAELVIDRDAVIAERRLYWAEILAKGTAEFDVDDRWKVLILGDSLSQDLFVALNVTEELNDLTQFRRMALDDPCMGHAAAWIGESGKAELSYGSLHCRRQFESIRESGLLETADEIILAANWQRDTSEDGLALAASLASIGKQVAIQGRAAFNDFASLSFRLPADLDSIPDFIYTNIRGKYQIVSEGLRAASDALPAVRYLDKLTLFCDRQNESCDTLDDSGQLMIYDTEHMTVAGVREYGKRIYSAEWFSR